MEFNKNKIIFFTISAILIVSFLFLLLSLNSKKDSTKPNSSADSFNIWIVSETKVDTYGFITSFKNLNTKYKNKNIVIEVFPNFEDYYFSLNSALISDKGPDLFVLNNNESYPIFNEQILGIKQDILNPNDFRKKYAGVFSDDLIISSSGEEFLKGIPVGYESLGVFYNRTKVRSDDLETISSLNSKIQDIYSSSRNDIAIGIGNGSTVDYVSDIVTQLFLLEDNISSIYDIDSNIIRQVIGTYLLYGDLDGYNRYNSKFLELSNLGEKSLYLFSRGELYMVVGYPSMINKIKEYGYSKSFLLAEPFPHYYKGSGKTLINYDYFVINKDSDDIDTAYDFINFLNTDVGATAYLDFFTYKLPALLSLLSDKLESKIHPDFNVVLGDFYDDETILSSFDKGIKNLYDKKMKDILDDPVNYQVSFLDMINSIKCKLNKIKNLTNFSDTCE